jgi:DNA-binding winged helix-turn-helix (wHTH) protein
MAYKQTQGRTSMPKTGRGIESALLQTKEGEKNYIVKTHPKTGKTYKIDKRSQIYKELYKDNAGQGTQFASEEKQVKTDPISGETEARWQK